MPDLVELLDVTAKRWRTGQHAYGAISWQGFRHHRGDMTAAEAEVERAICSQDFLRAADVVEFFIRPEVSGAAGA